MEPENHPDRSHVFPMGKISNWITVAGLLWILVLTLGGLTLLAFVVSNGFLPELDLHNALSLLAGVSVLSLLFAFAIAFLTFAGGCVLYLWLYTWEARKRGWFAGLFASLSASAMYMVATVIDEAPRGVKYPAIAVFLILMTACCVMIFRERPSSESKEYTWCTYLFMLAALLFVGLLLTASHTALFTLLYRAEPVEGHLWGSLALWLMIQAVSIGVIAESQTPTSLLKRSLFAAIFVPYLLLILSNNRMYIVQRTAQTLGIGSLPDVSLMVTSRGCAVLNGLSAGDLCQPLSGQTTYAVGPVMLKSRFGKEVLIAYASKHSASGDTQEAIRMIVLEAEDVLGWQWSDSRDQNVMSDAARAE